MKKFVLLWPMKSLSLLAFLFCTLTGYAQGMDKVRIEQGVLQGKTENNISVFKGVPFAKPPVAELRWKAPQAPESWEGIRQATKFAPAPMQAGNPPTGISEDSLYLNVWTPAKSPDEKIPVLVWIHGGGFSFGTSSDAVFNGDNLANKGIIVVTITYRLGQLGFLAHPELSAESKTHVSGNYGLLDQIQALKWIKTNIAAFGGDPNNVTISGESAGGISVSMLAASPLAQGLFHKAISQSGGSFGPTRATNYPGENMSTLAQAESEGVEYVKKQGISSIAELRKMDAKKFIPQGWSLPGGWPIVDGYVIPGDQYTLYEQGKFNDVPVLIGYNSDEGASFLWNSDPKSFIEGIENRYGKFASALIDAYSVNRDKLTRDARNLIRDVAFGWQTWSWARLQSKNGKGQVYLYYFDQHPLYPESSEKFASGSPHGQEIAYVFQNLADNNPELTSVDAELSETMARYWTNFVKFGDPNTNGLLRWPAFTLTSESVMYFQQEPKVGPVPDKKALEVLDQYFEWRRSPEGEKWAN